MNERDLVVHDEFISGSADKCKTQGAQLEQIIVKYIQILTDMHTDSLMTGETANALGLFIDSATLLQGTIEQNSNQVDYDLRAYITGINDADQYLF